MQYELGGNMVGGFARINYSLAHGGGRVDIKHRLDVCCLRQRIIETAGIQASEPDVARERDGGGGRQCCRGIDGCGVLRTG